MLNSHQHERVVAGGIIAYRHHACRSRIMLLDDARDITYQDATHGAKQRAIRRIAFHFFAHDGENVTAENLTSVLNEIPGPDMRHLAIHILQILMRHRYPFRLRSCTTRSGIHIRLTGEKHILLTILMALNVRPESLKIVGRHIELIQAEQVVSRCSR